MGAGAMSRYRVVLVGTAGIAATFAARAEETVVLVSQASFDGFGALVVAVVGVALFGMGFMVGKGTA